MTQPINFLVNLAGVTEVGRQQQEIERNRPQAETEHRASAIKEASHLSESQVQALSQHATARVEPRNEGGAWGGYYPRRRQKEEKKEKKKSFVTAGQESETGQKVDVVI